MEPRVVMNPTFPSPPAEGSLFKRQAKLKAKMLALPLPPVASEPERAIREFDQ